MIGEVVVDLGFADRETVEEAVASARAQGRPTGLVLVEQGVLRHDQLARVVAERFGLDYIDLAVYDLDMGAVNLLSPDAAKRYQAVPVGFADDGALLLAMADPTNVLTIDDIAMMTGRRVRAAAASVEDLNLLLARLARMDESIEDIVDEDAEPDAETRSASRGDRQRRADHQAGPLDRRPGDPAGRLGHPREPRRGGHARAVPRRRGALPGRHDQAQDGDGRGLAHQDHGRHGHLREARAAGRPLRSDRRRAPRGHPRRHPARSSTARAWSCASSTREWWSRASSRWAWRRPSWRGSRGRSKSPTAPCS